jgi:hypothetical protein
MHTLQFSFESSKRKCETTDLIGENLCCEVMKALPGGKFSQIEKKNSELK